MAMEKNATFAKLLITSQGIVHPMKARRQQFVIGMDFDISCMCM